MRIRRPGIAAVFITGMISLLIAIGGSFTLTEVSIHQNEQAQAKSVLALKNAEQQRTDRICIILRKQAAIQPPAGNPATNPSRKYDQNSHAAWAELIPAFKCPK